MHYWFYGAHVIWMAISWLVGIGLLAMLFWLLVVAINGRTEPSRSPEEILRHRYAAGEIETEEFERRLEELRKTKTAA
jgi:putative membrane protein